MALNAPTHLLLRLFSEDTGSSRTMAESSYCLEITRGVLTQGWKVLDMNQKARSGWYVIAHFICSGHDVQPPNLHHQKPAEGDENIREDPTMVLLAQRRADVENWCFTCVACPTRNAPHAKVLAPMLIQLVGYPFKRVGVYEDIINGIDGTI
ncbi:hypothetical protein T4B_9092 [Trichinella pseudospiralis]|uniref:Uncharacterized protein n=1 Tax=Trichinella pseudospiralis TaxID=6337 RepID=A0A0V1GVD0_TRIPS|nr:hypothetical protein T4B_9092 [Trichinella pseudospiralis]